MKSVVLIEWFEKSTTIAQCGLALDNEGVESPQISDEN
jgi:hypothetical protein